MYRVVVNVVDRSPKVAVIAHVAFHRAAPNLPSARLLLAVPIKGKPPVHPAQIRQHLKNDGGFDECMIMIGERAPGVNQRVTLGETTSKVTQNDSIRSRCD